MKQWFRHSTPAAVLRGIAIIALTAAGLAPAARALLAQGTAQADPSGPAAFTIFLRGQRIGNEEVTVTRSPDGWAISATGRTGSPLSLGFEKFVALYTANWYPRSLEISGQLSGQVMVLNTTFSGGAASSDVVQAGLQSKVSHPVSVNAVILPNNFYGAYEALAMQLDGMAVGGTIPAYIAPQAEIQATVTQITPRRIETPSMTHELRQFDVSFQNPGGALQVEVWVDARGRLARLVIPVISLAVMRDDLAGVMARIDTYSHPRDENVFVPANGFSLAGTITKPVGIDKPAVVILVSGSGPQDRDETLFGIPILGQVAGQLSDAGYFVVRYDKRGVGQSGGRLESASIEAYADDVRYVVDWLRKRKDIDRDRIAIVGHSEGGAVALLAGSRMRGRVHALGLLAAAGQTGRELTLVQQRRALEKLDDPEALKQEKIALQMKVMDAVVSGKGWESVPPELRLQADTAWFRSWLTFDPAQVAQRTNQPMLILHGALDTQIPPDQADMLEALSNARRLRIPNATRKVVVPGINHLLVPATTGEVDEYPALAIRTVAPEVTGALIAWLNDVFSKKD